jgi:uncharacterized protein (UPF0210 family)
MAKITEPMLDRGARAAMTVRRGFTDRTLPPLAEDYKMAQAVLEAALHLPRRPTKKKNGERR